MNREDTETLTRKAFDAAAPVYDSEYEDLHGIKRLRSIISPIYLRYFSAGQTILELNCGTGTDALFLGRNGVNVLATDVSPRMIGEVQEKVTQSHLSHLVSARILSYHDLHHLENRTFDGAYSNMGGINCTDDLPAIAASLGALVKPGGYFIATVMPDFCLWETIAFLARLQFRKAFRRRKAGGVSAHVHGGRVQTHYHSPGKFEAAFAPFFERVFLMGLNIFTPPPNSTNAYGSMPKAIRVLEKVDDSISRLPFFSSIGDHYLIVLRRTTQ